jgi:hypothetical protein
MRCQPRATSIRAMQGSVRAWFIVRERCAPFE